MYIYYVLRGKRGGEAVELEGDIEEEHFPNVDLDNGPSILNFLVQEVNSGADTPASWEECELTDAFFNREDSFLYFNGRWMRRSDTPWRKDRDN